MMFLSCTPPTDPIGEPEGYCVYCDRYVYVIDAPPVDDYVAWSDLATEHSPDCEWIATRAHQLDFN